MTGPPAGSRLVKACDHCHERKVKCDGSLPTCSACQKSNLSTCNVKSKIMYQYDHVKELERRVEGLERAVAESYEEGSGIKDLSTGVELHSKTTAHMVRDTRMVEEIGLLSLRGAGAYMGSMTGITLAALVNATLELYDSPVDIPPAAVRSTKRRITRATYPPRDIAIRYITRYVTHFHKWNPFLSLNDLACTIETIYADEESRVPTETEKSILLMIFALTSSIGSRNDPYGPSEYYRSALDFLPMVLQAKSLDSIRALLLLCLYSLTLGVEREDEGMDTWLLIGHAVRLSIELGLTRNNYKVGLSEQEHESRRRIWWCTFAFERFVATATGRVLGIRNEGIEAAYPKVLDETIPDSLVTFLSMTSGHQVDLRPAIHLLTQRRLLGDVLESVYITRARDRPSPSPEETLAKVYAIQTTVVSWAEESLSVTKTGSIERGILQLSFHQITLLLHRPSPTFPAPPLEVLEVCLGAARGTLRISHLAMENGNIDLVLPGWQGFHTVLMSGLTLAYCSWAGPRCPSAIRTSSNIRDDQDLSSSLYILEKLAFGSVACKRYLKIYESIIVNLCRIIDTLPWTGHSSQYTGESALETITENAGLSNGGYKLDHNAVLLFDELLAATNNVNGFYNGFH